MYSSLLALLLLCSLCCTLGSTACTRPSAPEDRGGSMRIDSMLEPIKTRQMPACARHRLQLGKLIESTTGFSRYSYSVWLGSSASIPPGLG